MSKKKPNVLLSSYTNKEQGEFVLDSLKAQPDLQGFEFVLFNNLDTGRFFLYAYFQSLKFERNNRQRFYFLFWLVGYFDSWTKSDSKNGN